MGRGLGGVSSLVPEIIDTYCQTLFSVPFIVVIGVKLVRSSFSRMDRMSTPEFSD